MRTTTMGVQEVIRALEGLPNGELPEQLSWVKGYTLGVTETTRIIFEEMFEDEWRASVPYGFHIVVRKLSGETLVNISDMYS